MPPSLTSVGRHVATLRAHRFATHVEPSSSDVTQAMLVSCPPLLPLSMSVRGCRQA